MRIAPAASLSARPLAAPRLSAKTLRESWRVAFEAAEAALLAATPVLPREDVDRLRNRLAAEREPTGRLLGDFARNEGIGGVRAARAAPREARQLLGLPADVAACVFNLDGVLIGGAAIHAEAWTKAFNDFLSSRGDRTHADFAPFNPRTDYAKHMHGRPRLDGVREFLASRGISLPTGQRDDLPASETVYGLANRKAALLVRLLDERPLTAFAGAREYLEIARATRMRRAVTLREREHGHLSRARGTVRA